MIEPLAAPHFLTCAAILLWDILIAGRIAGRRDAPRVFAGLSALAGLLIAPAIIMSVATASILHGRSLDTVLWVWPLTLTLIAVQASYALFRRLVHPVIGVPIAIYDVLLAAGAIVRYAGVRGLPVPDALAAIPAAQISVLTLLVGAPALTSPLYFHVPMLAPTFPARWRASLFARLVVASVAAAWVVAFAVRAPASFTAVSSYRRFAGERLRERPARDFEIGLRILPEIASAPSALALRNDLTLADRVGIDAVSIVIQPNGATRSALDSLARVLEQLRRDTTVLIVTLGDGGGMASLFGAAMPLNERPRIAALGRIAARLHPDIMLPVLEPYGASAHVFGVLPPARWQEHLARAAREIRRIDADIAIGVTVAGYTTHDSVLYAWAAGPDGTIDVPGFALAPTSRGAVALTARMQLAERWMSAAGSKKPHWVFSATGFPVAHGEPAQERAIWGELAWATGNPRIRGIVVNEAGDYGDARGLRTIGGRLRPAAAMVVRASHALRERVIP
jgi:hypothetical protein